MKNYVIDLEAKALASRLENTLIKSARFPEDYWTQKRSNQLVAIFRRSLHLKAETVMTGKTFMLDIFPSGMTVTKNMEYEDKDGFRIEHQQLPTGSRCQLCLFPGIYRITPADSNMTDFGNAAALVQTQNFVRRQNNTTFESSSSTLIKDAIVLCA
jgi:hypothetical protein